MKATLDLVLSSGIQTGAAPGAVAIVVNRDEVLWEGACLLYTSPSPRD